MKKENSYIKEWESQLLANRPFLISFAFRMTGSLAEAEDIVQDIFISCLETDPATIKNHKSWLTKVCSNKALDHLKLAYKKRESYTGTWLPDAVPESYQIWNSHKSTPELDSHLLLTESLTTTFLLLAEKLNPEERAIYLLNEIFEYSFKEISDLLNKSEEACRKTAQRARQSMTTENSKFIPSVKSESLITNFFECAKSGNKAALAEMLSDKSEFWSDGGGKVSAVAGILKDKMKIAHFFAWLASTDVFKSEDYKVDYSRVNARPGMIVSKRIASGLWVYESIMSFEIEDDKIARIYVQRNPDKLESLLKIK